MYDDKLYLAPPSVMLARLRKTANTVPHVMMVGHDPGMHALAKTLAGEGEPEAMSALRHKFPTAGLAVFAFDVKEWCAVAAGGGRLLRFVTPKRLA
ncbi:hypothetical protein EGT07_36305 [Herbaspirillum sp. HC18]|nr:hypothetical protein EGT07_36305 [Herbaspirillum sp. HC18]